MRLRNNIFAQYFPELNKIPLHSGEPNDVVVSIAQHCLDPRQIGVMKFEDFTSLVTSRKVTVAQQKRLRSLWEIAGSSVGCQVHEAARWEAQTLVRRYKAVIEDVKDTEKRMAAIANTFPAYECLLSIPGFGPIVSAMVLAAIGDPSRFAHRKQLLRLAGLDLSASRSGQTSDAARPVISKQGKAALRYAPGATGYDCLREKLIN